MMKLFQNKILKRYDPFASNTSTATKLFIVGAFIIIMTYIFLWFAKIPIVHPEMRVNNSLINYQLKDGENFFRRAISSLFDATGVEMGMYRPRSLAFFVQFIDTNLFLLLYENFPAWGVRLPLTLLAMIMNIVAVRYMVRNIFPFMPKGSGLFIGSCFLFFKNYQVSTYVTLRSAKLMAPAVCLFIIVYFYNNISTKFERSKWKLYLVQVIVLSLFATLDEQVLFIIVVATGIAGIFFLRNKKITPVLLTFGISTISYFVFYFTWGRLLFEYFTPVPLLKHPHQIEKILVDFIFQIESLSVLLGGCFGIIKDMFAGYGSIYLLLLLIIFSFLKPFSLKVKLFKYGIDSRLEIKNQYGIYDDLKTAFVCISSLVLAYILVIVLVLAHPPILTLPDLRFGQYTIASAYLIVFSVFLAIKAGKYSHKKIVFALIIAVSIFIFSSGVLNISKNYTNFFSTTGGHLSTTLDVIIDDNKNISFEQYPIEKLQQKDNSIKNNIKKVLGWKKE